MLQSQSAMVSLCCLEPTDEAATAAAATAHRDDVFVALPDVVAEADHAVVRVVVLGAVASVVEAVAAVVSIFLALKYLLFVSRCFPFHPRDCKLLSPTLTSIQKGHGSGSSSFPLFVVCLVSFPVELSDQLEVY